MIDPVKIGEAWIERAAVVGVVPQEGNLLIFLRGSKPLNLRNTFSREEIESLTKRPEKRN